MQISIGKFKINLEVILLLLVIWVIIFGHTCYSCSYGSMDLMAGTGSKLGYSRFGREGLANMPAKQSLTPLEYSLANNTPDVDIKKWAYPLPSEKISKDTRYPLPEGELDFLYNTPFKPECCPNSFSNSKGCACTTPKQNAVLVTRGGNNIPYSQY